MTTISFRIEESKVEQLEAIAESMDRNRSYVINQAISQYIDHQNWIQERIQKGLDDIEAGRTISLEDFNKEMDQFMSDTKAFLSKTKAKSKAVSKANVKQKAS